MVHDDRVRWDFCAKKRERGIVGEHVWKRIARTWCGRILTLCLILTGVELLEADHGSSLAAADGSGHQTGQRLHRILPPRWIR